MQVAMAVHVGQPVEERVKPSPPSLRRQAAALADDLLQGLALDVLHDDVGGAVGLDVAMRPNDVRVSKAMEGARLVDEAVEAPGEECPAPGGRRGDAPSGLAPRRVGGEVLLERDRSVQLVVERQVRDAEAARTEHADDLVLADAVALRQRRGMLMGGHVSGFYNSTFSRAIHIAAAPPPAVPSIGGNWQRLALRGGVGPGRAPLWPDRAEGRVRRRGPRR